MTAAHADSRIGPRLGVAVLLAEGYCSLAIEMIALRVLVPVAGQSIAVTSIVVTVYLGALALGYRDGGRFSGRVANKVACNLALAGIWSVWWLSRFGVRLAFDATAALPPLVQVALFAMVGLAPAAYLLAETVVLLVSCRRDQAASGKAGSAFSVSTIGNVAGALLTSLVVMQYLGIAAALALVATLLSCASLVVERRLDWRPLLACAVVATVGGANMVLERSEYALTTAHADYAIDHLGDDVRLLRVNGQNASREDGAGVGHPYIEWIEDRVFGKEPGPLPVRVLVIGAGGFSFGRGRAAGMAELVFVDVDARLGEIADRFLAPIVHGGAFVAMDGRAYLLRHRDPFDVIVLDAFADRETMPAHLQTREFFELLRARLAEQDGTLYMNLIAPPEPDRLSTRIDRTLRSVFAWCDVQASGDVSRWHNRVYVCERHALDGDSVVYSDADTRAEVDG